MWTNQDEMFADDDELRFRAMHPPEINEEAIKLLDRLAMKIADGDARVHHLGERPEIDYLDGFPPGDNYPKTLEVTYRES